MSVSRITSQMMDTGLTTALDQSQQAENTALQQVESGQKVSLPSDDPVAMGAYITNQAQNASVTQYLQNINTMTGSLQTASSALSSAVTALNQAVSLGTEGASGSNTAAQQQTLAAQVADLQQQMLNLANTSFQGQYVFAGTNASSPAFTADAGSASGVTYNGSGTDNQVEVAAGNFVSTGVPGSQIFTNSNGSVFGALNALQTALQNNDTSGVQAAVTSLNSALTTVDQQQEYYGSALSGLTTTQNQLTSQQTALATQSSSLTSVDMATAITNLSSAQEAYQAILDAGSILDNTNLLSLLGPTSDT